MKTCKLCKIEKSSDEFTRLTTKRLNSYCKVCMSQYKRKWLYGIDYTRLLELQNGVCAICKASDNLQVDHCHVTQKVRGLLCGNCNTGLGMFKDSKTSLVRAIEYLA